MKKSQARLPKRLEFITVRVDDEKFYISFSFDIDRFCGGQWWLQIYTNHRKRIYDEPFARALKPGYMKEAREIVATEFGPKSLWARKIHSLK